MNDWIEKDKVKCSVNGKDKTFSWDGKYIDIGKVKGKQVVTLEFPIEERREKLSTFKRSYDAIFKGNDVVDVEPKGGNVALYKRDHYRFNQPRYVKVPRFVCDKPIEW